MLYALRKFVSKNNGNLDLTVSIFLKANCFQDFAFSCCKRTFKSKNVFSNFALPVFCLFFNYFQIGTGPISFLVKWEVIWFSLLFSGCYFYFFLSFFEKK